MQGHERSKEIAFVSSSEEQQAPVQLYERTSGQTVALKAGARSRAQQPTASTPPQPRHIKKHTFSFSTCCPWSREQKQTCCAGLNWFHFVLERGPDFCSYLSCLEGKLAETGLNNEKPSITPSSSPPCRCSCYLCSSKAGCRWNGWLDKIHPATVTTKHVVITLVSHLGPTVTEYLAGFFTSPVWQCNRRLNQTL